MKIVLAIILGSLFGFSLYYSGAAKRKSIREMLRLENLTIMKIIAFGVGYAAFLISLTAMMGLFDTSHFSIKSMNAGVVLGGIIFGIGFGFVGGCPGTSLASFPHGNSVKTIGFIIGGLTGAFLFSINYGFWKASGLFKMLDMGKLTLFRISPEFPALWCLGYEGLLAMGLVFMGIAILLPNKLSK